MLQRKPVEKLMEAGNVESEVGRQRIVADSYRPVEDAGIAAHQALQKLLHRRFGQLQPIEGGAVEHYLHLSGNVRVFRKRDVA